MISNDSHQTKGQREKYGTEAFFVKCVLYECVNECEYWEPMHGSFTCIHLLSLVWLLLFFHPPLHFLCVCVHAVLLSLGFLSVSSFYVIFILWFVFISIQINPHSIFVVSSSFSSSRCHHLLYKTVAVSLLCSLKVLSALAFHQTSTNILWNMIQQLWRRRIILETTGYQYNETRMNAM